jgi:hypothetical protein
MPAAPENGAIEDVIVGLRIEHPRLGELVAIIGYDPDCEGPIVARSTRLLCHQRGSYPVPADCGAGLGAGSDLLCENLILFSDAAAAPIAEGDHPAVVAAGCYKPTVESNGFLGTFDGLPLGGCWTLNVGDNSQISGRNNALICEWSVHVRSDAPIPTAQASWGTLKSRYR